MLRRLHSSSREAKAEPQCESGDWSCLIWPPLCPSCDRLGKPSATKLPVYGNKVLALRNGTITLHGKHKTPTWTKLARTADVGARRVTVMGDVSTTWEQGK